MLFFIAECRDVAWMPSASKMVQEVIAVLVGTVVAAWIINSSPELQKLVRGGSVPGPLDNL